MSASNIVGEGERAGLLGGKESLQEVLDFFVTEEQLGVTLVPAAIENALGTPSEGFLPVLRNAALPSTTRSHARRTTARRPAPSGHAPCKAQPPTLEGRSSNGHRCN
jgi:hypothetical protein